MKSIPVNIQFFNSMPGLYRAIFGFCIGFVVMLAATQVFIVKSYDYNNMVNGIRMIVSGINPWAPDTRIEDFYNPPFSVLFLWPMLFTSPKLVMIFGGAFLSTVVFYLRSWVAFSWFFTNTILWLIAQGGIDMMVIGGGLVILFAADRFDRRWIVVLCRVLAYGLLMVKPQGGFFIVVFYILLYRDWIGLFISIVTYGVLFMPLYPDWFWVVIHNPPLAQTVAAHTLAGKFGLPFAILISLLVISARRWKYWEIGGALAGILMPYGMPGLPIFLVLTSVRQLAAIPVVILFSGALASITWVTPPIPVPTIYDWIDPLLSIYHVSMLGLALILACMLPTDDSSGSPANDSEYIDLRKLWRFFYIWLSRKIQTP